MVGKKGQSGRQLTKPDGGRKPKKHCRSSFSAEFKLAVCHTFCNEGIQEAARKHFLYEAGDGSDYTTAQTSEDEAAILAWIKVLREDGVPVSAMMLNWKALEIYR